MAGIRAFSYLVGLLDNWKGVWRFLSLHYFTYLQLQDGATAKNA